MLLVASETGHVYTFATKKLRPMISSEAGKTLIRNCLNTPDIGNCYCLVQYLHNFSSHLKGKINLKSHSSKLFEI